MKRCSNCGVENESDAKYCKNCANELDGGIQQGSSGGTEVWEDEDSGETGTQVWGTDEEPLDKNSNLDIQRGMKGKTVLHQNHEKAGAKMTNFGGWEMPLKFTEIVQEHKAVRKSAGVFDLSHMGEIYLEGEGAIEFMSEHCTMDIVKSDVNQLKFQFSLEASSTGKLKIFHRSLGFSEKILKHLVI